MALARCCLRRAFDGFSSRICYQYNNPAQEYTRIRHLEPSSVLGFREYSSFNSSPYVHKMVNQTEYEAIDPAPVWKYVERLIPPKTVPKPEPKDEYPSGWIPHNPESINNPYYIKRSRNHMLPVYLCNSFRGMRKITTIKHVQGDIWSLGKEIRSYLVNKHNRVFAVRVNEWCSIIEVKGDYVYDVRDFLHSKGF